MSSGDFDTYDYRNLLKVSQSDKLNRQNLQLKMNIYKSKLNSPQHGFDIDDILEMVKLNLQSYMLESNSSIRKIVSLIVGQLGQDRKSVV